MELAENPGQIRKQEIFNLRPAGTKVPKSELADL